MTDEPNRYTIEVEARAAKFLAKLAAGDKVAAKRIGEVLEALKKDPRPHGYEPVKSRPGHLRVRAGTYRIIYTLNDSVLRILVVSIGHRSDVYE